MLLVIILYILFASTFTLAKAAVSYMPPILFIGIRMLIAGSLLLSYVFFRRRSSWHFERKHAALFAGIILLHIYAAYVLEFIALPCVSSFKVSLLYSISPFVTAVVSFFLYKEKLGIQKWLGLIIGSIGLLPMLFEHPICLGPSMTYVTVPDLILFGAIFASVCGWLFMKELVGKGYSPLFVNGVGMMGGGLLALCTSFAVEGAPRFYHYGTDAIMKTILIMGLLILIANIIGYNFYGYLLKRYSATFLSFAGFLCPLFSALFGWLFLHETVSSNFFVSSVAIMCGLYVFYRQELGATS